MGRRGHGTRHRGTALHCTHLRSCRRLRLRWGPGPCIHASPSRHSYGLRDSVRGGRTGFGTTPLRRWCPHGSPPHTMRRSGLPGSGVPPRRRFRYDRRRRGKEGLGCTRRRYRRRRSGCPLDTALPPRRSPGKSRSRSDRSGIPGGECRGCQRLPFPAKNRCGLRRNCGHKRPLPGTLDRRDSPESRRRRW